MDPAKSQQIMGILVFKQFFFVLGRTCIRRARLFRYNQCRHLQDVVFLQKRAVSALLQRVLFKHLTKVPAKIPHVSMFLFVLGLAMLINLSCKEDGTIKRRSGSPRSVIARCNE